MLNKVEVRTSRGTLLTLELEDTSEGLLVEEIEGLDPVKATLVSSSFAQLDGAQYHSSRRETRNIKFKFGLEPDYVTYSIRDLRKRLYDFFMPKSTISLRFYMSDGLTVDITGVVESFETPLFGKESDVDVSIVCFDPDLIDLTPVVISGSTTSGSTETTVTYEGTVETGIEFVLSINRTLTQFTIYHTAPDGSLRQLDFAADLLAGDILTINTVAGNKAATLNRSGSNSAILYGISPQSNWIELERGDNTLRVYATGAAIPYTVQYLNRYGGL